MRKGLRLRTIGLGATGGVPSGTDVAILASGLFGNEVSCFVLAAEIPIRLRAFGLVLPAVAVKFRTTLAVNGSGIKNVVPNDEGDVTHAPVTGIRMSTFFARGGVWGRTAIAVPDLKCRAFCRENDGKALPLCVRALGARQSLDGSSTAKSEVRPVFVTPPTVSQPNVHPFFESAAPAPTAVHLLGALLGAAGKRVRCVFARRPLPNIARHVEQAKGPRGKGFYRTRHVVFPARSPVR
jgi:hypothetical protein